MLEGINDKQDGEYEKYKLGYTGKERKKEWSEEKVMISEVGWGVREY
jgi:hypothetical protein